MRGLSAPLSDGLSELPPGFLTIPPAFRGRRALDRGISRVPLWPAASVAHASSLPAGCARFLPPSSPPCSVPVHPAAAVAYGSTQARRPAPGLRATSRRRSEISGRVAVLQEPKIRHQCPLSTFNDISNAIIVVGNEYAALCRRCGQQILLRPRFDLEPPVAGRC